MSIPLISPQEAHKLISVGAILIDIRDADEHARERIAQARHIPLHELQGNPAARNGAGAVIFHCRSGNRTRLNAGRLKACAAGEVYVLEGGLDAWKKAGLPVAVDKSKPVELSRQVQIAAGSIILLGTVLGAVLSPWFYLVPGFVGAGLTFAGISGFCGLARVLMLMPWNRSRLTA